MIPGILLWKYINCVSLLNIAGILYGMETKLNLPGIGSQDLDAIVYRSSQDWSLSQPSHSWTIVYKDPRDWYWVDDYNMIFGLPLVKGVPKL